MNLWGYVSPSFPIAALHTAFEVGVIDALHQRGPVARGDLIAQLGLHQRATDLLLAALTEHGFVSGNAAQVTLAPAFATELAAHGELIRELCAYSTLVRDDLARWPDIVRRGSLGKEGRVRAFWTYGASPEVAQRHARLLRLLTRSQAAALCARFPFDGATLLDVGGNDGELAAQLCARFEQLRATVFDLPENCAAGSARFAHLVEQGRLRFVAGDFRRDPLPSGADIVVCKSVLNDWTDGVARALLQSMHEALAPEGTLLIVEPLIDHGWSALFELAFNFLIAPKTRFRSSQHYAGLLAEAGFAPPTMEPLGIAQFALLVTNKQ